METNELKQKQKEFLARYYFDYKPARHDAFVIRYKKELAAKALEQYQINREINK